MDCLDVIKDFFSGEQERGKNLKENIINDAERLFMMGAK
jgi:hypothetical protein